MIKKLKFWNSMGEFIKSIVGVSILVTLIAGCYWKMYAEDRVDAKIAPLIVGIFEIQTTLNKIVPENIKAETRREVEAFEKLLQKK